MNELTREKRWEVEAVRDNIKTLGGLIDYIPRKEAIVLLQESISEQLPDDVDKLLDLIEKMGWEEKCNDYLDFMREEIIENELLK